MALEEKPRMDHSCRYLLLWQSECTCLLKLSILAHCYLVAGNEHGRGFRDTELEKQVLELTRSVGIGAQFGGKYFCHDVRVIRLPRHGASCPVGIGVSCSADRQVRFCHFRSAYLCMTSNFLYHEPMK